MAVHSSRLRRLKARRSRRRAAPETRRTSIHVNPQVVNRTMASLGRRFYKRDVRRATLWTGPRSRAPKSQTPRQLRSAILNYHRILNELAMSRPPEPSTLIQPRPISSHEPVGPALLNLLDTSLSLPGNHTHERMFLPYMPLELPTLVIHPPNVVPVTSASDQRIYLRLRLMLKAVKIDNERYTMTLNALRRRIQAARDDLRHVKWLCVRSEQDIRNAEASVADLRQSYHEMLQRVIDRHAPAEGEVVEDEVGNAVPEQYQGPVEDDDDDDETFEPEGLFQRLLIDENSQFGPI